jgi:hypothetical protein
VEKVATKAKRVAVKVISVVESIIGTGIDLLLGKRVNRHALTVGVIQRLKGTTTKDKMYALMSGENTKCATGNGGNPKSDKSENMTLFQCKQKCDTMGAAECFGYTHSKKNECLAWTEAVNIGKEESQKNQRGWNGCWARGAEPFSTKYNLPGSLLGTIHHHLTNAGKKIASVVVKHAKKLWNGLKSAFSWLR